MRYLLAGTGGALIGDVSGALLMYVLLLVYAAVNPYGAAEAGFAVAGWALIAGVPASAVIGCTIAVLVLARRDRRADR